MFFVLLFGMSGGSIILDPEEANRAIAEVAGLESMRPPISCELWLQPKELLPFDLPTVHNLVLLKDVDGSAKVFSLEDDTSKVLVYRGSATSPFHRADHREPSLVDFWFLKYIESTGVVPLVYILSQKMNYRDCPAIRSETGCKTPKCFSFAEDHVRYTIMERLPGRSLKAMGSMSRRDAIQYGVAMLDAVSRIHAYNVVHGDLHAGNVIVVSDDGNLKFIDFENASIFVDECLDDDDYSEHETSFRHDVMDLLDIVVSLLGDESLADLQRTVKQTPFKSRPSYQLLINALQAIAATAMT